MLNQDKAVLLKGGVAADDRGTLRFVNDFTFEGVKRFYVIENFSPGFVRAWHGHKKEGKYFFATQGSFLVAGVKVDNWDNPSKNLNVERFVLSDHTPSVLYLPPGYSNGLMALTPGARLTVFSTSSLADSQGDDFRLPARYWDCWKIEER